MKIKISAKVVIAALSAFAISRPDAAGFIETIGSSTSESRPSASSCCSCKTAQGCLGGWPFTSAKVESYMSAATALTKNNNRSVVRVTLAVVALVDTQVNFLRIELRTGRTLVKLAHTERAMFDHESASKSIANARKALDAAKRFLPLVKDASAKTVADLRRGLKELQAEIEAFG